MADPGESLLTEVEEVLKKRFLTEGSTSLVQSTAAPAQGDARLDQLILKPEDKGRMPITKDQYLVRENPQLVTWEREVRRFLRNLSPEHGHRVSAVMIYEWATGIKVVDLVASGGSASPDLRKLNAILRFYFGKAYQTFIAGRKVPLAYRVKVGYYIKRHRPMTLTLYAEYAEGTLNP